MSIVPCRCMPTAPTYLPLVVKVHWQARASGQQPTDLRTGVRLRIPAQRFALQHEQVAMSDRGDGTALWSVQ